MVEEIDQQDRADGDGLGGCTKVNKLLLTLVHQL